MAAVSRSPTIPAAQALAATGVKQREVAARLGVTGSAVCQYLSGRVPAPDQLGDVLVSMVGARRAGDVLALIPGHEANTE